MKNGEHEAVHGGSESERAMFHPYWPDVDLDTLRVKFYQLYIAVEQSPAATAITDTEGRIEYVNRRFLEVTGYSREELIGKTPAMIQSGMTPDHVYRELWQTLRSGRVWRGELQNRKKSGELYWEAETITPVRDDSGRIRHFIAVFHNIAERKRLEEELEQQATRDHLTGTQNRRAFDVAMRKAVRQAERSDNTFSLLLFDIDHFKSINDQHGHDTGDIILKRLATLVGQTLRSTDLLARWGGEEFAILLQDTTAQGASIFAERLRQQVAETRLHGLAVTISLGIAEYRRGDDPEAILTRADSALYRAKRSGRNRVGIADTHE
ncbi:MAG: diguanylate cyclase [Billgrantia sp.]